MISGKVLWTGLLVTVVLLVSRTAAGAEGTYDRHVTVLARALSYDENLKTRAGDTVSVAVLFKPGDRASEAMAEQLQASLRSQSALRIQGLPMRSVRIPFMGSQTLDSIIKAQGLDALYLCPGLESEVPVIRQVTRTRHVTSVGYDEDLVREGIALGIFEVDSRCVIVINLPAARAEGAAFGGDLLRLAKVIR